MSDVMQDQEVQKKHSVIIVDDHLLFAKSLHTLLDKLGGFEVLAMLKNGKELTRYFLNKRKKPDLILLDIKMPVMDGIQAMEWLREHRPDQKVLALTMEDDEETIIKMVRAGARGYLLKDIHPDNFRHALDVVIQKGAYYTPRIADVLSVSSVGEKRKRPENAFTDREREFVKLTCSELTYKQIASMMHLSPKTIEGYWESVSKKVGVRSRVGLVIYCMKNNLFKME